MGVLIIDYVMSRPEVCVICALLFTSIFGAFFYALMLRFFSYRVVLVVFFTGKTFCSDKNFNKNFYIEGSDRYTKKRAVYSFIELFLSIFALCSLDTHACE